MSELNNEKALEPQSNNKALETPKRELTPKNRLFLHLIVNEGKKTLEAYKEAGYTGEPHAAYQLRSDLKEELIQLLEAQGVDRAGLMLSLKNLISLPTLEEQQGRVSAKTKLSALNLLFKMVEASKPANAERPKITAFIVNNHPSNNEPNRVFDIPPAE